VNKRCKVGADSAVFTSVHGQTNLSPEGGHLKRRRRATGYGGGIATYFGGTITGSLLSNNSASDGGGIFNADVMAISNCTRSGNTARHEGGSIKNLSKVTIVNSTLSGNYAYNGGGIMNGYTVAMYPTQATYAGGTLTMSNTTLYDNHAVGSSRIPGKGGGIFDGLCPNYTTGGQLYASNCTLSGNYADQGGGLWIFVHTPTVVLTNVTVTANVASPSYRGGGLFVSSGESVLLRNTLIARNTNAPTTWDDVYGAADSSSSHNLIGDGTGMWGISNGNGDANYNQVGVTSSNPNPIDPLLGPLQKNGGPTLTHALLAGSPALNGGTAPTAISSNSPVSANATSVTVADARYLAAVPNSTVLLIEGEQMLVTSIDINNSNKLYVQRGYNGTTAVSHAASVSVYLATDQRGQPRVRSSSQGPTIDIGAYEVSNADTELTLTSSASSAPAGQSVTFTATVSAVAPGVATLTGWVTFRDADTGQVLARVQLSVAAGSAQAQVTLSWPSAGTHHITATYNDFAPSDPDFNPDFNSSSGSLTETIT
jgi:hypothetical protein